MLALTSACVCMLLLLVIFFLISDRSLSSDAGSLTQGLIALEALLSAQVYLLLTATLFSGIACQCGIPKSTCLFYFLLSLK
jgi:hypothetical protein